MVSKVCHSQLSSSTLASAAHMPPWAAPVWERVGYSLVMTAVRARRELSSAARRPAPPAPMITTSKVCCWVIGLLGGLGGEGEDGEGAEGPGEADHGGVEALVEQAPGAAAGVVVDDHPQAVVAVEQGQGEHGEVVDAPERVGPAAGHEGEVDPVEAAVEHVHDREVAEHQQDQQDPGDAHEQPGVELEVAPAALGLAPVGRGRAGERGRGDVGAHGHSSSTTWAPMLITGGTARTTNSTVWTQSIWRWRATPWDQKSNRMIRRPLRAWKITTTAKPISSSPTKGLR